MDFVACLLAWVMSGPQDVWTVGMPFFALAGVVDWVAGLHAWALKARR